MQCDDHSAANMWWQTQAAVQCGFYFQTCGQAAKYELLHIYSCPFSFSMTNAAMKPQYKNVRYESGVRNVQN